MIKFGISENYVSNWGIVQAIREVYQNFIDYGDFEVDITKIDEDTSLIKLRNTFRPESWEFLKLGFSKKDKGAIGKHGEGLKLAGLVFKRNNLGFKINTQIGQAIAEYYEDNNLGKCYGLKLYPPTLNNTFEVVFEAKDKDIKMFKESCIKDEDILHNSYYGSIVNREPGNIYIGGLYVCFMKDFNYAFNFKPEFIELGRDREVPSTFDLKCYANRIVIECQKELKLRVTDINNIEFEYGSIPKNIAEKFFPIISEYGKLQLQSGKTIITDSNMIRKISNYPTVAKRIEKINKDTYSKTKKSPQEILKDFKGLLDLSERCSLKYDTLIKLSKNWKHK